MNWIANQPYIKVERKINRDGQVHIKDKRFMYLYPHKVVTKYREFPLEDVFDVSFRRMGTQGGMLYLHTSNGAYPYMVPDEPAAFIQAFRHLTDRQP